MYRDILSKRDTESTDDSGIFEREWSVESVTCNSCAFPVEIDGTCNYCCNAGVKGLLPSLTSRSADTEFEWTEADQFEYEMGCEREIAELEADHSIPAVKNYLVQASYVPTKADLTALTIAGIRWNEARHVLIRAGYPDAAVRLILRHCVEAGCVRVTGNIKQIISILEGF